jgi:hypothetical protein
MAKPAAFEAMMGSNLYCMSIIMCFLAHLAIGHWFFMTFDFINDNQRSFVLGV